MTERTPGFSTLAVHAGAQPDPTTGARATPIYQTTSYVFESVDHAASLFGLQMFGNIYTRMVNPTNAVLEERVAALILKAGRRASRSRSGHAAQVLVFHACCCRATSSSRRANFMAVRSTSSANAFQNFDWHVEWADRANVLVRARPQPKTKAIFIELIANPGGVVTDIAAVAQIAWRAGVPYVVDNTLATPYLFRPIE